MNKPRLVLSAVLASAMVSSGASAGTSACDHQKLIVTNTTEKTLYLIDQAIYGNANLDNITKNVPVPPFAERVVEVSSDIGTHGNASAMMRFSSDSANQVNTIEVKFDFNAGWTNYFICKVTHTINSNDEFFITSHEILDGVQVIVYAKG